MTEPSSCGAAIYCRISHDKTGAGLGVERQKQDCRELAARLGWSVTEVFCDNDLSAYSGKRRPRYQALLEAIRAGRIDAVLTWHTDPVAPLTDRAGGVHQRVQRRPGGPYPLRQGWHAGPVDSVWADAGPV
jgi:hypothetical protein